MAENGIKLRPNILIAMGMFLVMFSIVVERITWIGQPNLGPFRGGLSILIGLIYLVWVIPHPVKFYLPPRVLLLATSTAMLMLYEIVLYLKGNENERIYFMIFCCYWIVGFYFLARYYSQFFNILIWMAIIAGVVGWMFWIIGPDLLLSLGIGPISRFWGQSVFVDGTNIYRTYSVFSDHQTFSAFMQFAAVFVRVDDFIHPRPRNFRLIVLFLLLSIPSFSTTGFIVFLLLLGSYLNILQLIIIVVPTLMLGTTIIASNTSLVHIDSLQWRIIFILRQIEMITMAPHPHVQFVLGEGGGIGFTNDCFFTSGCYSHGAIWGIIYLIYLVVLLFSAGTASLKQMSFIVGFIVINSITNGVPFTSTPIMVFLPLYLGLIIRTLTIRNAVA